VFGAQREAAVLADLSGGQRTLREMQDTLSTNPIFGTRAAVISAVQSMARRGAIARTPDACQEGVRRVALYALPELTKEEALREEVLAFVRDLARNHEHDDGAHNDGNPGACARCKAEAILAKLEGCPSFREPAS
jgi:hypothetical protein